MYRRSSTYRRWAAVLAGALAVVGGALPAAVRAQGSGYVNFETIPTRALALSPDGKRLFATNVDVAARPPRVVRTLLVGDEPRDVVFAGPGASRAFISAVRRGQNHPADTVNETQVPGVGRADVWVVDASNPGAKLGGAPLAIVQLFADKPGALTVSKDGGSVFVAIFTSGNQTTVIRDGAPCGSDDQPGSTQTSRQRAAAPFAMPGNQTRTECELVAKAVLGGTRRGMLFDPASRSFAEPGGRPVADADLRAMARAPGQEVTFTCMYPGGGRWFASEGTR